MILTSSKKSRENSKIVLLLIRAALKDSKANYTSLLLQYLLMAVIFVIETNFHSRGKTYITSFSMTLTKLTNYLLTSPSFLCLSTSRVNFLKLRHAIIFYPVYYAWEISKQYKFVNILSVATELSVFLQGLGDLRRGTSGDLLEATLTALLLSKICNFCIKRCLKNSTHKPKKSFPYFACWRHNSKKIAKGGTGINVLNPLINFFPRKTLASPVVQAMNNTTSSEV